MTKTKNLASIEALISRTREVEIDGHVIELSLPDETVLAAIRKKQAAMARVAGDEITSAEVEAITDFNTFCVSACVGCDESVASRLIAATGGEAGVLVRESQIFMGLRVEQEQFEDLDPNPS